MSEDRGQREDVGRLDRIYRMTFYCRSKQKDRIKNPVFCCIDQKKHIMSAATFKLAVRHVGAVTAVGSDYTATIVDDIIAAGFCCRLIALFIFIFFVHFFTSSVSPYTCPPYTPGCSLLEFAQGTSG